ncbi:hypothetical protein ACLOJK_041658 [Asimina triloba]
MGPPGEPSVPPKLGQVSASRRYQAVEWLRQMDQGASDALPKEPSEEEFCLTLRNGLILCNVLNKVNPGAVLKVVENPTVDVQATEGAAQSAIQYFENMRNFLVAVGGMKLLTFEASDLEKGGSSNKVVDCILCLKGYHEWKQAGGMGTWRYGGLVKITALPKSSPSSLVGSESVDEMSESSDSSYDQQLLEVLSLSSEASLEESKAANALSLIFDRFGLGLLRAYLTELNGVEEFPLNSMLVDTVLRKAVEALNGLLISQRNQFCICGVKQEGNEIRDYQNADHVERLDLQEKQLEEIKSVFHKTKAQIQWIQSKWDEEQKKLEHHIQGLELAASSYHKVLEENRMLYNQSGPDLTTAETWGVNYRALNDLFQISKERRNAISYEVGVQMIEIYNEQVRDLLNGLNVPDASLVPVNCTQDVLELMRIGQKNRAVGATALNERSSRSHSVLTVHVQGKDLVTGTILRGCLHLVDLAGSERVDKSEAVGERLKEAQHINKSLSALGDVISALAQKSPHVPYRNSKLTQVLQDSLGGHAKTLMFVHINPEVNAFGETISTLKFAERVASIELGAARSNKETGEIRELKEEISNLKLAMEKKEADTEQVKAGAVNRTGQEAQRMRAVSPLYVQRYGVSASLRPEMSQRPVDDGKNSEVRSSSSEKQRRYRFPSAFQEKESDPKLLAEESLRKIRSPSPPVRRSLSTDRGALIRSRLKQDTPDEQPTIRLQFPAKVSVNRTVTAMPTLSANENSKVNCSPQELNRQNNITDLLYNLHRNHPRKVHPEQEEEQFKSALNVRQGGIRKSKAESKSKLKQQLPVRMQKSDVPLTWQADADIGSKMEEARKSDFSEPENENGLTESPALVSLKMKRFRQNFARISQNLEQRVAERNFRPADPPGKYETA